MIKARLGDSGLLIGLSLKNLEKLQAGQPIAFDLSKVGLPAGQCVILFGVTEEAIAKQLADAGLIDQMHETRGSAHCPPCRLEENFPNPPNPGTTRCADCGYAPSAGEKP